MYSTGYITLQYSTILVFVPYSYLFPKQTDSNIKHVMVRYSTRTRESSFISSTVKHNVPEHAASDRSQTTNGEKFVKSGERTYNADGHIQDGPKILTGSNVSPPTHPNTNNLRYEYSYGSQLQPTRTVRYGPVLVRVLHRYEYSHSYSTSTRTTIAIRTLYLYEYEYLVRVLVP